MPYRREGTQYLTHKASETIARAFITYAEDHPEALYDPFTTIITILTNNAEPNRYNGAIYHMVLNHHDDKCHIVGTIVR